MSETVVNIEKCRCCMTETDVTELRSIFKFGKICGQIKKLADMLKFTTNLDMSEEDGLPAHICNKCVVHVSKAYAFKQQCVKSDEELRKEQLTLIEHQVDDVFYVKNDEPSEEPADDDGYTYHLVEEYEDEERIDEEAEYGEDKNVQIILKVERRDDIIDGQSGGAVEQYNIEMSEVEEPSVVCANDQDMVQDEVFECEVENDGSSQTEKVESDEDLDVIPKMVFRKYNKRNKKVLDPPFVCQVCSKVLSNYSSFKYHMQLHSDKKPFLCADCGESFKTRNAYDGHIITHNEDAMHKCHICDKAYRQAASLRCHMLSHTGEKPFVCNICGKGMTQKSGYKKHMLIHSGEKPHRCDHCGKDFRYSSNLIIHKRSHIGDKKHKCDVCEKKFVGIEQLKRHALIHTGKKPFCCDICNKCFNRKSSLQAHQNTHSSDRKKPVPVAKISKEDDEHIFGT
ncbi:zinc finger protein 221-like isoform X1 [Bradysia coprophila]|uniref:zinc finger protein 221-like isoform X1 n=1 Tax=Bradysia coprophila TaxID=38358 RepID=UPI00187D99D3|nr:zinc finger protein 221-like isoform X1 [Bradysia coprophila]